MNKLRLRMLTVLILTLSVSALYSREFSVSSSIDKKEIYIGDILTYRIRIAFRPEQRIRKPGAETIDTGPFIIVSNDLKQNTLPDGSLEDITTYYLSIYELGEFTLPPVKIYAVKNLTNSRELKTRPLKIKIVSVTNKLPGMQKTPDIMENNPPALPAGKIADRYYVYGALLLSLLLIIAAVILYRKYHRYRAGKIILPFQKAARELESLLQRGYHEKKLFKPFYYDFSMIIRSFLENKHGLKLTTMTGQQIKKTLTSNKIKNNRKYLDILTYADKVKFAPFIPEQKTTENFIKWFQGILRKERQEYEELQKLEGRKR